MAGVTDDIRAAMARLPGLNSFGVGLFDSGRRLSAAEYRQEMDDNCAALLGDTEGFVKTCDWLSGITPIKTINKRYSSYGLKHLAERDIGYITNGTFIAAAIHCGFQFWRRERSPNVYFNMSERSLKAHWRSLNARRHAF